ncbi:MAG: GNAT family N-acetyltransferase [Saprospirales bacterium]|nr:GNAT family N-acetyltransferase [Saprospirales bacterium]
MEPILRYECKPFAELTPAELYAAMALRQEVFIVEQNCPYLDADGKDLQSWHLLGRDEAGKLLAYVRILPIGISYPEYPSIGRVVTSPAARGKGYGKELMEVAIETLYRLFGPSPIKIGAQTYLLKFYESLGFRSTGEEYLEDGIPHTKMVREFLVFSF